MNFQQILGYYVSPVSLPLGIKVEVMPTSAGITVLSGDGGVLQTDKQAAACKRIAEICKGIDSDIELSQEVANSVQSILGGCTLRKEAPEVCLSVVVASANDVPTISLKNDLSARGRNLAEFCFIAAAAAEANGIDGLIIFNALKEAIKSSEIVTATWLGKADISSARSLSKTAKSSSRPNTVKEDEYVRVTPKPDPAEIGAKK